MALNRSQVQDFLLQEFSKKGYVSEKEIEQCCDENNIDLFDVDKVMQFLIDRKVLIQDAETEPIKTSDDEVYDKSQIDYDEFYAEVLELYPEQKYFIGALKRIQPPKRNEWQVLIPQAKQGNDFAKKRVVSMYARTAYRQAFNFSRNYGSDFMDSFADAITGLYNAIDSYDFTSPTPFPGYYSLAVFASMQRNYGRLNSAYTLPNHYYQDMFSFLGKHKFFVEKHGIGNFLEHLAENEIEEFKEKFPYIYNYLLPTVDFNFNQIEFIDNIENICLYDELHSVIEKMLSNLPPRENKLIHMRYGVLNGKEFTLEEIGVLFGVSRERIRQLEAKALKRLRHPKILQTLNDVYGDINIWTASNVLEYYKDSVVLFDKNEFSLS